MVKSVFITGASTGIGFSLAKEFISRCYKVYAGARTVEKMEPLAQLGAKTFAFDTTLEESILKAKKFIEEDNGGVLDILYLNAGVGFSGTLFDSSLEEMQHTFNTNIFGQIRLIQVFHKLLLKNKATVAFTSSISFIFPMPFNYAYTASKSAFDILARQLALEAGKLGLKVFVVRSGAIESEIWTPPLVPPSGSLYYVDGGEPLGKAIETKRTPSADYAKAVVNDLEKAVRKNRVYTLVYRGSSARQAWLLSFFPFVSVFMPFVFSFLGINETFEKINKKLNSE